MRAELNRLDVRGRIVIGEGERDQAPMLFNGEEVGTGEGPEVDIALDPLEGTTICAKNLPNSLAVIAVAHRGALLNAPDVYMEKIAIGPFYPDGLIDLDMPADEAIRRVAQAKGVKPREISACVLDRPRHARLVEMVRATGASIRLIGDGDVAGIIHTTDPDVTGIDIYLGTGGAPEGVLAAAALRCIGGQMCGRLICDTGEKVARAERMGIADPRRIYRTEDMASGDVLFAATGVTDGNLLDGVSFKNGFATTHTIVTRSHTGTQRWMRAKHRIGERLD
jgi:fructose-1,6-bisphosphatase II / sedoheptulose-1,7-bisphosphatase